MNARMRKATEQMVVEFKGWVKSLAEDAAGIRDASGLDALERRIREEGQSVLGHTVQGLLQAVLDDLPARRTCPRCGGRRRHKGQRERGLISSVGAIRLAGPYWYCRDCGGQHALEGLAGGSVSRVMRELLSLLGTALASFARRIVDIWHAYQHVHEASRKIFGEGTPRAGRWAKKYCDELRKYGGWTVWNSLRRVRYKDRDRQEALEGLLTFLRRNADRMDYPTYERAGRPISNGSMESFCKQLGQRLKGPGMRWSMRNIDPMAALVSLWVNEEWDTHWQSAA